MNTGDGGAAADIARLPGTAPGRSRAVGYHGLVWAVSNARDSALDFPGQMTQALALLDVSLVAMGTDKTRLLSVQVFLADLGDKPAMDAAWRAWLGPDPAHWPQRACLGVALSDGLLVEIVAVAAAAAKP